MPNALHDLRLAPVQRRRGAAHSLLGTHSIYSLKTCMTNPFVVLSINCSIHCKSPERTSRGASSHLLTNQWVDPYINETMTGVGYLYPFIGHGLVGMPAITYNQIHVEQLFPHTMTVHSFITVDMPASLAKTSIPDDASAVSRLKADPKLLSA